MKDSVFNGYTWVKWHTPIFLFSARNIAERLERGELKINEADQAALNNNDMYRLFINEALTPASGCRLAARELHEVFHSWYENYLSRTGGKNMFSHSGDGGRTLIGEALGKRLDKEKIGGVVYYLNIGINTRPNRAL